MLLALVLCGFLAVPALYWLAGSRYANAVAAVPFVLFSILAWQIPRVSSGDPLLEQHRWIPSLAVDLAFRLDGLSLLFALLITGIGTAVFLYASTYLSEHPGRQRFFAYLGLFMASMLGAVLADQLVLMLIFWELTSLTSFLLMGFSHAQAAARRSAQQGLLVTVIGGLALTAAILLIGHVVGDYSWNAVNDQRDSLISHPFATAILLLVVLAAFTKSAQVPFHFWLPNAMVAPTPVSAYLHSATMVKLGVYLLSRFDGVLGGHPWWTPLLAIAGMATMLISSLLLFRESDIKRVLAYSTLTALGTLVLLIGLPGDLATTAMVVFLIVHALYKACLFLVAGAIDHACGTRDIQQLSGLRRAMPVTAITALLGGLSMAGIPPLFGFIGKELMYEAALTGWQSWLVIGCMMFANATAIVAAGLIAGRCFLGQPTPVAGHAHDPPWTMAIGPLGLGCFGLGLGLSADSLSPLLHQTVAAITGHPQSFHLQLWHGIGTPLMLSIATVAMGGTLWFSWAACRRMLSQLTWVDRWGCDALYDRCLVGLAQFSSWLTRHLQSGSLATYTRTTVIVFALAITAGLVTGNEWRIPAGATVLQPLAVLAVLLIVAAIAVAFARSFLAGIAAAGIVGFLTALVFLLQGAPDLAFTQFSVEALAVVVILLIVGRMPMHRVDTRSAGQRKIDLVVAMALGVSATVLLLAIISTPFNAQLSEYYQAVSYSQAHGRNIVNVIIVDFRGLDTLGEITVLSLAAIAALTLGRRIKKRRPAETKSSAIDDASPAGAQETT